MKFKLAVLAPPFVVLLLSFAALLLGAPQGVPSEPLPPQMPGRSLSDILVIIAAITASVASTITLLRSGRVAKAVEETKVTVEATKEINEAQTKELGEVKVLVDGRYGEVLQRLADVERLLADETGRKADKARAVSSQKAADEQAARVVEAKIPDAVHDTKKG